MTNVTLKDLRQSERLVARARGVVAKIETRLREALDAVDVEEQRHSDLVERYRTQGVPVAPAI